MTYYDELEVRTDASPADIRAAYRELALENHPDRGGSAKKMARLTEAYAVLRDPEARATYDRSLARERRQAAPRAPRAPRPAPARQPTAFESLLERIAGHVVRELDRTATEVLASRMAGRPVTLEEVLAATEDPARTKPPPRGRGRETTR